MSPRKGGVPGRRVMFTAEQIEASLSRLERQAARAHARITAAYKRRSR